jgi:RNA polymerase sigma-70 factor, ECF subfamily
MPVGRTVRGSGRAARDGQPQAVRLPGRFEYFYLEEYSKVVALAHALSGSRVGAEDIAQEAFLRAYRDWDRVGSYEHQAAWVRRVAANLAVSVVRRRLAEARALVRLAARTQQEPSYAALPGEDGDFWRAVRRLPRRQAQVVALVALGDLSTAEVAATLGCSQRMVQTHLQKARATLAQRLGLPAEQGVDR